MSENLSAYTHRQSFSKPRTYFIPGTPRLVSQYLRFIGVIHWGTHFVCAARDNTVVTLPLAIQSCHRPLLFQEPTKPFHLIHLIVLHVVLRYLPLLLEMTLPPAPSQFLLNPWIKHRHSCSFSICHRIQLLVATVSCLEKHTLINTLNSVLFTCPKLQWLVPPSLCQTSMTTCL